MKKIDERTRREAVENINQADGYALMTLKGRDFNCLGDGADPASLIALAIANKQGLFDRVLMKLAELEAHAAMDKKLGK